MRSPRLKTLSRILKLKVAKSPVLPTTVPISGVRKSLVRAPTTEANAAPITTPTAISTTFPRRINFLKPSSMSRPPQLSGRHSNAARQEGQEGGVQQNIG